MTALEENVKKSNCMFACIDAVLQLFWKHVRCEWEKKCPLKLDVPFCTGFDMTSNFMMVFPFKLQSSQMLSK